MTMEKQRGECAYDRALCRAVWQRVAPEGAYPTGEERGTENLSAEERAAALTLPGAEADPCCMGTEAALSLEVVQGFVREELGTAQVYACLARRLRGETARLLRAMAEDEKRHARELSAAAYLIAGKPYRPRVCAEQPEVHDLCALLRQLYHEEACGGFNYARAAEETLDTCLAGMFSAMSADEYRHADALLRLLGRQLAL